MEEDGLREGEEERREEEEDEAGGTEDEVTLSPSFFVSLLLTFSFCGSGEAKGSSTSIKDPSIFLATVFRVGCVEAEEEAEGEFDEEAGRESDVGADEMSSFDV